MTATLQIREPKSGRVLGSHALQPADLALCGSEFWREHYLRRNRPDVYFEDLDLTVLPGLDVPGLEPGFAIQGHVRDSDEPWARQEFPAGALRVASLDLIAALLKRKELDPKAKAVCQLHLDSAGLSLREAFRRAGGTSRVPTLLAYSRRHLPACTDSDDGEPGPFPVYYLAAALERAEHYARCGALHSPPLESGCFLMGHPCRCPESGELYVVITEALRIRGAEAGTYHMTMSGAAWIEIEAILRRRAASGTGARAVGFAHGHPFLPGLDHAACARCEQQAECNLTSVFISDDDSRWMASVFAHRHPWQVAHVFGLDARAGHVQALFSLQDGQLQPRPYTVLTTLPDDFPAHDEEKS